MIRVLFIAPVAPLLPRLAWHDELSSINRVRDAQVRFVAGSQATIDEVAEALSQESDIVVFAGHGTANRLILSDGEEINGEWLATQAKAGSPEVVVIGACYSGRRDSGLDSIGESVSQAGLHAIVFEVAVDDRAGAVFSREFVRSMSAQFDVVRATRVSSAMCAKVNAETAAGVRLHAGVVNGYREFARRFKTVEEKLDDVITRLVRLEEKTC